MDVAKLGISIVSDYLKTAQEADRFTQANDNAAASVEKLQRQSAIAHLNVRKFNEETQKATTGLQGLASSGGNVVSMVGRLAGAAGIAGAAMAGLTMAVDRYTQMQMRVTRSTEESLTEQARILKDIQERYKETTGYVEKINQLSRDTLTIQLLEIKIQRQKELNAELNKQAMAITRPTQVAGEMGEAPTATAAAAGLEPFNAAIEKLQASIQEGKADLKTFADDVAKIGLANPALQQTANWLIENAKEATKFANSLQEVNDQINALKGDSEAMKRLGISIKQAVSEGTDPKKIVAEASAWDRASDQIERHIKLMEADTKAVGMGTAAREELRTRGALEEALRRDGKQVENFTDQINDMAKRARDAAQALHLARLEADLINERQDIFRSGTESRVSRTLERAGLTEENARGKQIADYIRMNEVLKEVKSTAQDFTTDLVRGLMNGESAMKALGNAATNLASKLAESAIQDLLTGNFVGAAVKGVMAIGAAVFGGQSKKDEQRAQAYWDAVARATDNAFRSAMARIDTDTLAGALAAQELEFQRQRREETYKGGLAMASLLQAQHDERLKLEKEFGERQLQQQRQIDRRRLDYADREFNATNDTTTLAGALAAFQRSSARAVLDEQEAGGQAMIELEKALIAEEIKIRKEFAEKALEETIRSEEERMRALTGAASRITDYLVRLETTAAILSPGQALANAQATFNATLALAQGGNIDAYNRITSDADALIQAASSVYSSGVAFQQIYQQVKSGLLGLPAVTTSSDPVVLALTNILAGVNSTTAAVNTATGAVNTGNNLQGTNNTLQVTENQLLVTQNNLLDASLAILGQLRTLNDQLNKQFAGQKVQVSGSGSTSTQWSYNEAIQQWVLVNVSQTGGVLSDSAQYNGTATQANIKVPNPVDNTMLSALNKIVFNTWAIAFNTARFNGNNPHVFGIYAGGGYVGGRLHSDGGTMIEAELGEYIVNRRAANMVGPETLAAINQGIVPSGGGGGFSQAVAAFVMVFERMCGVIIALLTKNNEIQAQILIQNQQWMEDEARVASRAVGQRGRG
jgi:hypothetical protein